jgi:hypothetical protein
LSFITIQISFKFNSDLVNFKFHSNDFLHFFLIVSLPPPSLLCSSSLSVSSPEAGAVATSRGGGAPPAERRRQRGTGCHSVEAGGLGVAAESRDGGLMVAAAVGGSVAVAIVGLAVGRNKNFFVCC